MEIGISLFQQTTNSVQRARGTIGLSLPEPLFRLMKFASCLEAFPND